MSGHVFVVHGDLLALHADAYAVSGNPRSRPSKPWRDDVGDRLAPGVDLGDGREVARFRWKDETPGPWVVPVAGDENTRFQWYADAIRAFVACAAPEAKRVVEARVAAGKPRDTPLVAMPNLGSGGGGQRGVIGRHIHDLLDLAAELAHEHAVDIACVFFERASYEAAQVRRLESPATWWRMLDESQRKVADDLASRAVRGNLAVFIGAGVSVGAGLPSWSELLAKLESTLTDPPPGLDKLEYGDRAMLVQRERPKELIQAVEDQIKGARRHALGHALLAALPVREVVTTNYDDLFERAVEGQRGSLSVIPYDGQGDGRWLMKLHGCAKQGKGDFVLTRASFNGFDGTRGALAGLLGGLLLTRHVLFVGTSLADTNVLRIVDGVQRAMGDGRTHALGTNLAVGTPELARERLWQGVLGWEHFTTPRALAIFLDRLAANACTGMSFLLQDRFAASAETMPAVRAAIAALDAAHGQIGVKAVGAIVDEFLEKFGRKASPSDGSTR